MKKLLRRLLSGVFSLVTTCVIMASPIAAMVYAAEPVEAVESFGIKETAFVTYSDTAKAGLEGKWYVEKQENKKTSADNALTGKE